MSREHDIWLSQAEEAARAAGALIREHLGRTVSIRYKGPSDPVTEIDLRCQALIAERLLGANPTHGFLGEEDDGTLRQAEVQWVVDPIDGTKNFAHGYPVVCVSIGLEVRDQMMLGVVYDPSRDELFSAIKGQGARLNGEPIQVSDIREMGASLMITGFARHSPAQFELLAEVERNSHGIRRDGSAALNLCYVAAGRLEGFWELGLSPWDVAAGSLILAEAGGTVTDLAGKPFDIRCRQLLATNTSLHKPMVDLIAPRLAVLTA